MNGRQAFGIDINEYSRVGGVNYELVKQHFHNGVYDFLIIKAGLGLFKSPLLDEQVQKAADQGIPFSTYHLPDPRQEMREQARRYVNWLGVEQPSYIVDLESPSRGVRPPNRDELLRFIDELEKLTQKQPLIYTRMNLLTEIGLLRDAKDYYLWIAQYPFNRLLLPGNRVQYLYFHDFLRDYEWKMPPSVRGSGVEDKVVLWQFSEKGAGPYYVYNLLTADPKFTRGMEAADLNISTIGREDFLKVLFGSVPEGHNSKVEDEEEHTVLPVRVDKDPYPGLTNQDMINYIYKAARPFTKNPWGDWIVRANLEHLALVPENREKPYGGPKVEELPGLTIQEIEAVLAAMNSELPVRTPTYPGLKNQDIINLIFKAAAAFTPDPWKDWILRAGLEFLAVPDENRGKPYTGPRIENLLNLGKEEKKAILALM
jgi:GH25 family lysozyme M1 (1,4-beta-N-acetylmuramidase)